MDTNERKPGSTTPPAAERPSGGRSRTRRQFLRGASATAALGTAGVASAGSSGSEEWGADVDTDDGVVDRTGTDEVRIDVGVGGDGFNPAAVRVDPGTTVRWEWPDAGGEHAVVAADDSFESGRTDEAGATVTETFETAGVYRYASGPDRAAGMQGAVVVGESTPLAQTGGPTATPGANESGAGGGGVGSGVAVTAVAVGLTAVTLGGIYLFGWRDRPEPSFRTDTPAEEVDVPPNAHTGPMCESDVAPGETESVAHDAFDPVGTGTLLAIYFAIITLAWLFMYFVEFLGNGPSVVG